MKVVVTSSGKGLDAQVDSRFGRCPYFVFVDTDTEQSEDAANESAAASGGAGIAAAQQVAAKTPEECYRALRAQRLQRSQGFEYRGLYGITGSVRDAVAAFQAGTLQVVSGPDARSHNGMGH